MVKRRILIAGNWKMNTTFVEAKLLINETKRLLSQVRYCDVLIIPPYTLLYPLSKQLQGTKISLGAQNIHSEKKGAFTGEISAFMVKDVGCDYVLIGHSERRKYMYESDILIGKKIKLAIEEGLKPILCVGENLEERKAKKTHLVIQQQIETAIKDLNILECKKITIAYEPIWAIGTGKVATPNEAQEVHSNIREQLRYRDVGMAENLRIIYGGSVKPDNSKHILQEPDVDGALVGGASLNARFFADIVKNI